MLLFSSHIITSLQAIPVPPSVTCLTSHLSWFHKAKSGNYITMPQKGSMFKFDKTFLSFPKTLRSWHYDVSKSNIRVLRIF